MDTTTLNTPSATCGSCREHIREVMEDVTGVADADLDIRTRRTTVTYDPSIIDQGRIEELIVEAGYPVES